jgi:eukaryotic-like serine/threonine-protein kinase
MRTDSSDTDKLFDEIRQAAKHVRNFPQSDPSDTKARIPSTKSDTVGDEISLSVPGYKIISEIHRGGQGVVFKALQKSTQRIVALKFMLQGSFATSRQRFRFEREIDLASRLNHPNIVTIYDSGIADNQPFCAMEFVDGNGLSKDLFKDQPNLQARTRQIMQLFLTVSDAVAYAHQRGVIHRDLKPNNILVDQNNVPHVVDFGLAKMLAEETTSGPSPRTMTGEFVGTLAYASPEQTKANSNDTDTRSDVYSLAVVFYELLTGNMPYDVEGSIADTLTNISRIEPTRPTRFLQRIDSDVEIILLKALSKDPQRRYQNAAALAEDIRHYLNGQPIDARRDSAWYVLKKTLHRHRIFATAVAICLVMLVAALITVSAFYFQASIDRDKAKVAQQNEETQRKKAQQETVAANTARQNAEFSTYLSRISAADASIRVYDAFDSVRNLSAAPQRLRNLEWWLLLNRVNLSNKSSQQVDAHIPIARYSIDQAQIISVAIDGNIYFHDAQTLVLQKTIAVGTPLTSLALHESGNLAFVGRADGIVNVVDLKSGQFIKSLETGSAKVNRIEYSPQRHQIAAACGWSTDIAGVTCIWNDDDYELLFKLQGHAGSHMSLAYDQHQNLLATCSDDVCIWDAKSGQLVGKIPGHGDWVFALAFSPDGRWIATGAGDGMIRIWRTSNRRFYRSVYGHTSSIHSIQFNSDSRELLSASDDRTLRTWDTSNWTPKTVLWGSLQGVTSATYRADEKQILSSAHGRLKTWTTHSRFENQLNNADYSSVKCLSFAANRSGLVSGGQSGHIKHWAFGDNPAVTTVFEDQSPIESVDISDDEQLICWATADGKLRLHQTSDNSTVLVADLQQKLTHVEFINQNRTILATGMDKIIRWFDVKTLGSTHELVCSDSIRGCAIDESHRRMATIHADFVAIRDLDTGAIVVQWDRTPSQYESDRIPIAIDGNNALVAVPNEQTTVGVFDATNGNMVGQLSDHTDGIHAIIFSHDGTRLLTSSRDGKIKFWDTQRWAVMLTIGDLVGYAEAITIAPDSNAVAAGLVSGQLKYWKTTRSE